MRIVSPGVVVRDRQPRAAGGDRRLVIGRLIGRVICLGWLTAATPVLFGGHHAPAGGNAPLLVALGLLSGAAVIAMHSGRRSARALPLLLVVADAQAAAALIAMDGRALAAIPFFCALATIAAVAFDRRAAAAQIALGAATLAGCGLLAPERVAASSTHALLGAFAVAAAGGLTVVLRARSMRPENAEPAVADYSRLHDSLVTVVAADPERFALLTLDLDHFAAGDPVLREIGRALLQTVGGSDVVARNGADEFTVLATDTDLDGATLLAQRIEQALARIDAIERGDVHAAIGIAIYPRDGRTPLELLANADSDLQRAKELRRAIARAGSAVPVGA